MLANLNLYKRNRLTENRIEIYKSHTNHARGDGLCYSPVPLQPFVVVAVKEVRLGAHRSDVRVDAQELQQSARSSLLHPDDNRPGQLLSFRLIEETRHGIIALRRLRLASRLIPVVSSAVQLVLVVQQVPGSPQRAV